MTLFDALPLNIYRSTLVYLSPRDTYALLAVSKTLHSHLISAMLDDENFTLDETGICTIIVPTDSPQSFGPLSALQLALHGPLITTLSMKIVGDSDVHCIAAREIRTFMRVLQKTSAPCGSLELTAPGAFLDKYNLSPLNSEFNALLAAITVLPSLVHFRVAAPSHWDFTNQTRDIPSPSRRSTKSHKSLSVVPPMTIHIESLLPFLPSSYTTTLSLLTSRTISALRLQLLISAADWVNILSGIVGALPALKDLALSGVHLRGTRLVECLSRFRSLETLVVDTMPNQAAQNHQNETKSNGLRHMLSSIIQPALSFRSLITLSTSPPHLTTLLETRASFPSLSSVNVRLELSQFSVSYTLAIITDLVAHLKARISHRLDLSLDVLCAGNTQRTMYHSIDLALSHADTWEPAFAPFQALRMHDFLGPQHSGTVLARWLTLFPSVKRLSFAGDLPPTRHRAKIVSITRSEARHVTEVWFGKYLWDSAVKPAVPSSGTHFVDLPDDVLLTIFGYLRADLYAISRLSRRLHFLALPPFLAVHKIKDPSKHIELELRNPRRGADILSALSSALFLSEIQSLTCVFGTCHSIAWFIHDVGRLIEFIDRFPAVSSVSLSLIDLYELPSSVVNDVTRSRCREAVASLLDMVLSKGCQDLTIRGPPLHLSGQLNYSADSPVWPAKAQSIHLSDAAITNSKSIRSFTLAHKSLVAPAGLRWILSALRHAGNITVLSIATPREPSAASLLIELAVNVFPRVTELTFTHGETIFPSNLVDELLRVLPLLKKVTFPRRPPTSFPGAPGMNPRVFVHESLTHLTAPVPTILHLLGQYPGYVGPPVKQNPLPALKTLVILLSQPLPFSLPESFTAARTIQAALDTRAGSPTLQVILHVAYFRAIDIAEWWYGTSGFNTESNTSHSHVETLMLTKRNGIYAREDLANVIFPIVSHLPALRSMQLFKTTNESFFESVWNWTDIADSISKWCPRFEEIMLNDKIVYLKSDKH
ncbi:hypothetical protein C8F01DRAFT_1112465 [Mycena amicta]|nr:hypothetical protein C8F01DRAFT_1112465 [Mycena amicta]